MIMAERSVLDMIAADCPITETMERLTRPIEEITKPEVLASVLFVANGRFVRHGAAPTLPAAYTTAVYGAPIGPNAGPCGPAACPPGPEYATAPDPTTLSAHHP